VLRRRKLAGGRGWQVGGRCRLSNPDDRRLWQRLDLDLHGTRWLRSCRLDRLRLRARGAFRSDGRDAIFLAAPGPKSDSQPRGSADHRRAGEQPSKARAGGLLRIFPHPSRFSLLNHSAAKAGMIPARCAREHLFPEDTEDAATGLCRQAAGIRHNHGWYGRSTSIAPTPTLHYRRVKHHQSRIPDVQRLVHRAHHAISRQSRG